MLTNPQPPQSCPHGQHCTCVDGFVAGEVPLVAEGGLAAVTLVGLVTVDLQRMSLEGGLLGEPAVTLVAEEGSVLWEGREGSNQMGSAWVTFLIGYGMDLGWRREAARANVGASSQVQVFTLLALCCYHLALCTRQQHAWFDSKVITSSSLELSLSFCDTQAASKKPAYHLDISQRGP